MKLQKQARLDNDLPKLSAPAHRALATVGVKRLEQLTKFTEEELKHLHGIGPNALGQLKRALAERGLSFQGVRPNRQN